jgi:O-antigen/teichoic acid export membrane protein
MSGLFLAALTMVTGIIMLPWLEPTSLGLWQSYTVFTQYSLMLTLGVISGLNRELPYWLGAGKEDTAMKRLSTTGYFSNALAIAIIVLTLIVALALLSVGEIGMQDLIYLMVAVVIAAVNIITNFLGATFRTSSSFKSLSTLQWLTGIFEVGLLPLVYYYHITGLLLYKFLLMALTYFFMLWKQPFKVKYKFEKDQFMSLVRIGGPMYFWSYLVVVFSTLPRLCLASFAGPQQLGLYAPAASIDAGLKNIPNYINRYVFPKIAYLYGKTKKEKAVYDYIKRKGAAIFFVMLAFSVGICFILPPAFEYYFPKYLGGLPAAQIAVFATPFTSLNGVFHNALISINVKKVFKYLTLFRFLVFFIPLGIMNLQGYRLIISVSVGMLVSEMASSALYFYFLRSAAIKNKDQ